MGGCELGGQQVAWATTDDASIETEEVESVRARTPPCPDQRSLCMRAEGRRDRAGTSRGPQRPNFILMYLTDRGYYLNTSQPSG